MDLAALPERLARVRETIDRLQSRAGWSHPVTIVAVTKTHGPEAVRAVAAAGLRIVGENRVQEALAKQEAVADCPVEWHLIGSLQRNKVRHAVGRFGLIHSVDRATLARELHRRVPEGERQRILVQVNCSGESQKGGVAPADLEPLVEEILGLDRLEMCGLMTMAALATDEAAQRRTFSRLRELRDGLKNLGSPGAELSMGMSGDYPIAVAEGATMVRLGTALLGERNL